MATETITCERDSFLDIALNRDAIAFLSFRTSGTQSNPVWRFNLSPLVGRDWVSAVLQLSYESAALDPSAGGPEIFISYILRPIVLTTCTSVIYDTGLNWDAELAENSVDNDHDTRVIFPLSSDHSEGDIVTSPDISPLLDRAIDENNNILNLIMYGTGVNSQLQRFDSLETTDPIPAVIIASGVTLQATTAQPTGSGPQHPAVRRAPKSPRRTIRKGKII